jgi:hypothetical protein
MESLPKGRGPSPEHEAPNSRHPAGIRLHWQYVAVHNPAIGHLLSKASEFADANHHPWDLKARSLAADSLELCRAKLYVCAVGTHGRGEGGEGDREVANSNAHRPPLGRVSFSVNLDSR